MRVRGEPAGGTETGVGVREVRECRLHEVCEEFRVLGQIAPAQPLNEAVDKRWVDGGSGKQRCDC
nr:hypothetical protein GCM10017611_56660 [Rhodococcus wratislaviensis]